MNEPIRIYLASPYSHPEFAVRAVRYFAACKAAGELMDEGLVVFSPIAHSHSVEVARGDGRVDGGDYWLRQDFPWLDVCDSLVILELNGIDQSRGVAAEIERWQAKGGPIVRWSPGETPASRIAEKVRYDIEVRRQASLPSSESILDEAARLTSVDRRATYGHPSDNFGRIAQMLNAYLGPKLAAPLDATDVGMMMACTKIARHGHSRKRDNLVDLVGYANCISVCEGHQA